MAVKTVTIGTYSRNGMYQITAMDRDINSTILITVRETIGENTLTKPRLEAMKKFALRAVPLQYEGQVNSATVVRTWSAQGYSRVSVAISQQAR